MVMPFLPEPGFEAGQVPEPGFEAGHAVMEAGFDQFRKLGALAKGRCTERETTKCPHQKSDPLVQLYSICFPRRVA